MNNGRFQGAGRFVLHLIEMVVAMVAGMMLLDPVWRAAWPTLTAHPDAYALTMAFDMAVGMGLWMWVRGHDRRMVVEMCAVMVAPFVLLLVPFYLRLLSGEGLLVLGHVGMVVGMLALMLVRIRHYSRPPTGGWRLPRRVRRAEEAHG